MPGILDLIKESREDYTDKGWDKFLKRTLEESQCKNYYELMGVTMGDLSSLKGNYRKMTLAPS